MNKEGLYDQLKKQIVNEDIAPGTSLVEGKSVKNTMLAELLSERFFEFWQQMDLSSWNPARDIA